MIFKDSNFSEQTAWISVTFTIFIAWFYDKGMKQLEGTVYRIMCFAKFIYAILTSTPKFNVEIIFLNTLFNLSMQYLCE